MSLPVQTVSVFYVAKTKAGHDGYAITLTMPVGADDSLTTLIGFETFAGEANRKALELLVGLRKNNAERTTLIHTEHAATIDTVQQAFGTAALATDLPPGAQTWINLI